MKKLMKYIFPIENIASPLNFYIYEYAPDNHQNYQTEAQHLLVIMNVCSLYRSAMYFYGFHNYRSLANQCYYL